MADPIKAWSFSRLSTFENCPYQAQLAYVDKIAELPRPAPVKGNEHANDRGSRIHQGAEDYVKGKRDEQLPEMKKFEAEFTRMRKMYAEGDVSLEHMWCFDRDWRAVGPKDFDNIWLRVIIDGLVFLNSEEAVVIDYKTGKKWGNEVKHAQQCQLYQLSTFLKYPQLKKITTELWYLDQDDIMTMSFTREQGLRFWQNFNDRGMEVTGTTLYKPKPNGHSCRFCPYGPEESSNKWLNKNGACPHGV
jgi:hypothetical protein